MFRTLIIVSIFVLLFIKIVFLYSCKYRSLICLTQNTIENTTVNEVSDNFGPDQQRDIDLDGDNDSYILIDNVFVEDDMGTESSIYVKNNKVYLVGTRFLNNMYDLMVFRFNSDGTYDNSFSGDGVAVFDNIIGQNSGDLGFAIYVDDNNKTYITGYSYIPGVENPDLIVLRLDEYGNLDNSFNTDGIFIGEMINTYNNNVDDWDVGNSIVVNNNKIYVGGWSWAKMAILRLNYDGTYDNNFGDSGIVRLNISPYSSYNSYIRSIALKNDKIYACGDIDISSTWQMLVVRLNNNGSFDNTFSGDGILIISNIVPDPLYYNHALSIYPDNNSKVYIAGTSMWWGTESKWVVIRLNYDGSFDANFGNNGIAIFDIEAGNREDIARSISIDNNNRIYVTGISVVNNRISLVLMRLNPDGTLDNSFFNDGILVFDSLTGNADQGRSLFIDMNNFIYLTGVTFGSGGIFRTFVIKLE
ncbi:MAG: hypothetical protein ABDH21_01425 [bacterium]